MRWSSGTGTSKNEFALSDIINVGYSQFMNSPRVTLSLKNPGMFGDQVSFCAPVSLMPRFSTSPIIDELIKRIDAARRGGPAQSVHPRHRR